MYSIPALLLAATIVSAPVPAEAANLPKQIESQGKVTVITQTGDEKTLDGLKKRLEKFGVTIKWGNNCIDSIYPGGGSNQNKPENKPENNKPENNKPENNKPENNKPENNKPENNKPENNKPENNKPEQETPGGNQQEASYIEQVVKLVNEERAKAGLSPVAIDKKAEAAALVRAKEIRASFSHTRPNGSSFSTALTESGAKFRGAGENIAWGQKTPQEVMKGWMNSDGHRANILNKNFTSIGVGFYQDTNGRNHWVQLFTY